MLLRLLQTNSNHAREAQDTLVQTLREQKIAAAIVAEPYFIPNHPCWIGDTSNTVAIVWQPDISPGPCTRLQTGTGYVIVELEDFVMVGCYASPNKPLVDLEDLLTEIGDHLEGYRPRPILLGGDLNGKSVQWGSPFTDVRGEVIGDWIAQHDLSWISRLVPLSL